MKSVLIVGAGGMSRSWGRMLANRSDVKVVGWADILDGLAANAAQETGHPEAKTGTDFPALLDQTNPDFVLDVTVPEAHCDVTVHALSHGYPVLGEKPMAHSIEAARKMVAASESSGKLYMVSQSRRYNKNLVAYKSLVDQIGDLGILNSDFYLGPHFGGFRDEMPSPLILDMAIHTFDAARKIVGSDPMTCWAKEFNPSWSWMKGDSSGTAVFEFANGAVYTYRGSWVAEGLNTSWEGEWRAHGSLGAATWDGHDGLSAQTVTGTSGFMSSHNNLPVTVPDIKEGIEGALEEFLAAIDGGPLPQGECHDNIHSLEMVFAVIESAKTGKTVEI